MKHGLSISKQVLILVTLPLVIQLSSLAWLAYLQNEAETEAADAFTAKETADAINQYNADIYAIIFQYGALGNMPIPGKQDLNYRNLKAKLYTDILNIKKVAAEDTEVAAAANEAQIDVDKLLSAFTDLQDLYNGEVTPELIVARKQSWRQIRNFLRNSVSGRLVTLGRERKHKMQESPEHQAKFRKQAQSIMFGMAAINLILTVTAAVFITRTITNRLRQVAANADKLAKNEPLSARLSGSDEITELDNQFHNMAESLKEAERQKQEVTAMITHDLRSPLTTIKIVLDNLDSGKHGELDTKGKEYLSSGKRNTTRVLKLVNDLLDIEKLQAGMMTVEPSNVSLDECFGACEQALASAAEKERINLDFAPTDIRVRADEAMLDRVLYNLVSNAIKFSPPQSHVKVEAREAKDNPGMAEIIVFDQGPGISAEGQKTIFDRFKRGDAETSKDKEGSGLGLAICQELVKLQGGKISVRSEPGRGAAFSFTLPRIDK